MLCVSHSLSLLSILFPFSSLSFSITHCFSPPPPSLLSPTGGNRAGIIYADILMSVYEDIALKHDQYMSLLRTCYGQLNHSLIHSFIHSLIHSLTHSLTHSFTHSFIHSFIHSLTHSLTHSFTHLFTHSFIHSLVYSFF